MLSESLAWLVRRTHRVHRLVGSALCLMLAVWFASGIVMTFATYPYYEERERLAALLPLTLLGDTPAPKLSAASSLELSMVEGEARWLYRDARGRRRTLRTRPPFEVTPLDPARARRVAAQLGGANVRSLERLTEVDQWTVGGVARGAFPLYRVALDDPHGTELYLCAATGEIVQASTRNERLLAWLGPIPHWVYPTMLRRDRAAWRTTVLWLAGLGLAVTFTGLVAGLHVQRRLRRRGAPLKDRALGLHQQLGLWFGLFASSWLFSGALSLTPFGWTGDGAEQDAATSRLFSPQVDATPDALATLEVCRGELEVRTIQFTHFAGELFGVCLDGAGQSRLVPQGALTPRAFSRFGDVVLDRAARLLSPDHAFTKTVATAPDDYYYPSHDFPFVALPFVRIDVQDRAHTSFYLDAQRPRVVATHTARTRLERWLYHGLHSLDFAWLTAHPWLWRTVLIAAMLAGLTLSALGAFLFLRRTARRLRR